MNKPLIPFPVDTNKTSLFKINAPFSLECGKKFDALTISYSTYGQLNQARDNVIWVCHALTADANPKDWWQGLVGKHDLFNPDDHFIVCANVIGSPYGSTSPLNCDEDKRFDAFPQVSIRDNVKAFIQLRKHLSIDKIHTLIGGSMGGHQAMEWAISEPEIVENLILLATSAKLSAWAIAFNQSQRLALLADRTWGEKSATAAKKGLKAARSIALLSYRNHNAYNHTQSDDFDFHRINKAVSYQNYQGDKLVNRFNAYSYYAITQSMDSHDVGRKRGGIEPALAQIKAKTLVIGIDSDYLFPLEDSQVLADFIPHAKLEVITSNFGHDGFLIEHKKISQAIEKFYTPQKNSQQTIGLFGLGCVGQGFVQLNQTNPNLPQIKSIAVKHEFKARKLAYDKITTNQHQLLNDVHIDTIIETINNDEQAYRIAKSAVLNGKKFISASKKMIAENLAEIIDWNKNNKHSFLYEAAVAGSIPIIRNLDLYFEQCQNQSIKAILNGSSNYILTQMHKTNKTYTQALSEAQVKGFAETDPIADVGGFDAKYKAVILAAHAFGVVIHPDEVKNFGIQNISITDIDYAKEQNCCIKQVVTITKTNQGIAITIMPELVPFDSELGKTDNEDNLIIVKNNDTEFNFKGAGAGSIATGTAVIADLKASVDDYQYSYSINPLLKIDNDFEIKVCFKKHHDNAIDSDAIKAKSIEEIGDYLIVKTQYSELSKLKAQQFILGKSA